MAWSKTYSGADPLRVNKWLAAEGVCSRREAEALIADGLVSIDGGRVDDPGRKIEPGQTLTLADGKGRAQISVIVNKPMGYVSAHPEGDQVPAARLLTSANLWSLERGPSGPQAAEQRGASLKARAPPLPTKHTSLAPLGRLDQDSRGLLILSEDGVLAKALVGETSALDKEYVVYVEGRIDEPKLALLQHGMSLDNRVLKRAKVDVVAPQTLRFILNEGMKRQIRRMCEAVTLDVLDLQRVRIGPLVLGDLPEGKWRPLTTAEREDLVAAAKARP